MKTLREQAHELVDKYTLDVCFKFLQKHLGDNDRISQLKSEFVAGKHPHDFAQRLRVLINDLIDEKKAGDKKIAEFIANDIPIIEDFARINQRNENNQNLDDSQVLDTKTSNDLDRVTLRTFLAQERTKILLRGIAKTATQQEKLRELALADNGHIYKGTLLALGKFAEVRKVCPSASESKFVYFRGIERSRSIIIEESSKILQGNLLQQYEQIMDLLQINIPLVRDRARNQDYFQVPLEALRELIANAFIHRDFSATNNQIVSVEIFDNRIEIKNAGKINEHIDLYNVHDSFPRNRAVMTIFRLSKFAERFGSGINTARAKLKEWGLPDIEFSQENDHVVKVIVYRKSKETEDESNVAIKQPTSPIFLTRYPFNNGFIGRQYELQTLHAYIQAGKHTILVHGMGGIGKTSLVQKYIHTYQNDYTHILWIRQGRHLLGSFLQKELFENLHIDFNTQETELNLFLAVLQELTKLHGNALLVIDNYEPTDTDQIHDTIGKLLALPAHWHLVCTSRMDMGLFEETIHLDALPAHEAVQMFQKYAVGKPQDAIEIDTLLQMVGYHTLTAELLAKTYKQSIQFTTIGKFHDFLKEKGLQDVYLDKKIFVEGQSTTLYKHLSEVFTLAKLTADELWILKQWTVLPTTPHQASDFLTWIQDTDLAYENTLLDLAEKGWLQTENRLAYTLHPFLHLFLHQALKPTLPDCQKMYDYFLDLMGSGEIEANPLAYQWTIAIGEAMIQYIDFTKHKIEQGKLWDRVRFVYMLLGDYPNAIRCVKEYVAIAKVTVGEQHQEYATALNNLAYLYHNQGNYAEALPLYQEALQIDKEVLGERHSSYAASLNNLAYLYHNQGNYAEALPLYQEALQIWKEVLGQQHPSYATALNNLATLYDSQGNYIEALSLLQESLQIRKEVLGERHPSYAIALHNIGTLYFKQGNYTQAKQYLEEAYSICLEKLGEKHPNTQRTKEWLDKLPDNV